MNEIETKRKELEEYYNLSQIFNKDDANDSYNFGRLEGFNLGVDLGIKQGEQNALKKFLDKINKIAENWGDFENVLIVCSKLKQSLNSPLEIKPSNNVPKVATSDNGTKPEGTRNGLDFNKEAEKTYNLKLKSEDKK